MDTIDAESVVYMSLSTVIGLIAGFTLLIISVMMSTDDARVFLDLASVFMVFGGTLAAAYMSYQARYVNHGLKSIGHMLKKPMATRESLATDVLTLIKWGYMVQSKGLIALENEVKTMNNIHNALLQWGANLVATGYKPEEVRVMMETAVETTYERNLVSADVLKKMASDAPAFGMMGTLVGLVAMLQSLGDDMSKLGQGMAVALLTTLYGVVSARLVFLPAAQKLEQKEQISHFRNVMVAEGLVLLSEKQSPRYMQDRLNSFLDPSIHFDIDKQMK